MREGTLPGLFPTNERPELKGPPSTPIGDSTVPARVLVVEDDRRTSDQIERALAEHGDYTIYVVPSVEDALVEVRSGCHDVMLLDLSLPEGLGLDSLRRACGAALELPVVVVADDDDDLALQALRMGAQDHLWRSELGGPALSLLPQKSLLSEADRDLLEMLGALAGHALYCAWLLERRDIRAA